MEKISENIHAKLRDISSQGDIELLRSAVKDAMDKKNYNPEFAMASCLVGWKKDASEFTLVIGDFKPETAVTPKLATPMNWAMPIGPVATLSCGDLKNPKHATWTIDKTEVPVAHSIPTKEGIKALKSYYSEKGMEYKHYPAAAAVVHAIKTASFYVTFDEGGYKARNFVKNGLKYNLCNTSVAMQMSVIVSGLPNMPKRPVGQPKYGVAEMMNFMSQNVSHYVSKRNKSSEITVEAVTDDGVEELELRGGALFAYEVFDAMRDIVGRVKKNEIVVSYKSNVLSMKSISFNLPALFNENFITDKEKEFDFEGSHVLLSKARLVRGHDEQTVGEINKSFYTGIHLDKNDLNDLRVVAEVFVPINTILKGSKIDFKRLVFSGDKVSNLDKIVALRKNSDVFDKIHDLDFAFIAGKYNAQVAKKCTDNGITHIVEYDYVEGDIKVVWSDLQYNPIGVGSRTSNHADAIKQVFSLSLQHPRIVTSVPVHPDVGGYFYATPIIHNLRAVWTNIEFEGAVNVKIFYSAASKVNWARTCQIGTAKYIADIPQQKFYLTNNGKDRVNWPYEEESNAYIRPLAGRFGTTTFKTSLFDNLQYEMQNHEGDEVEEEIGDGYDMDDMDNNNAGDVPLDIGDVSQDESKSAKLPKVVVKVSDDAM